MCFILYLLKALLQLVKKKLNRIIFNIFAEFSYVVFTKGVLVVFLSKQLFFLVSAHRFFTLVSAVQRRYSVAKIDVPQAYEQGRPKLNGLSDPRLGTMDRAIKCTTDGANQQDSPGYFGHIELAKPVFHIGFITTVMKVLRCVSFHSSKLLIDKVRERDCKQRLTITTDFVLSQ